MKKSSVLIGNIPLPTLTFTTSTSGGSTSCEIQLSSSKAEDLPEDSARWLPPEERIVVAGRELTGGMIYVGTSLRRLHPGSLGRNVDPALINPELPIASSADKAGENMGYWPSYSEISPESRAR